MSVNQRLKKDVVTWSQWQKRMTDALVRKNKSCLFPNVTFFFALVIKKGRYGVVLLSWGRWKVTLSSINHFHPTPLKVESSLKPQTTRQFLFETGSKLTFQISLHLSNSTWLAIANQQPTIQFQLFLKLVLAWIELWLVTCQSCLCKCLTSAIQVAGIECLLYNTNLSGTEVITHKDTHRNRENKIHDNKVFTKFHDIQESNSMCCRKYNTFMNKWMLNNAVNKTKLTGLICKKPTNLVKYRKNWERFR